MGEEAGNLLPHSPGQPAPNRLRGPGAAGPSSSRLQQSFFELRDSLGAVALLET